MIALSKWKQSSGSYVQIVTHYMLHCYKPFYAYEEVNKFYKQNFEQLHQFLDLLHSDKKNALP